MNDKPDTPAQNSGASGSRWEPVTGDAAEHEPEQPPAPASVPAPVATVPSAASSAWGALGGRGKASVAGVAAALLLGGGVAGFGIGHATNDGPDGTGEVLVGFNGQQLPDGDRDGDGDGSRGGFGRPGGMPAPGGTQGQSVPVQPDAESGQLPS